MRTIYSFTMALLLTTLVGCGGTENAEGADGTDNKPASKAELTATIEKMENELVHEKSLEIDIDKAQLIVGYYKEYADRFPEEKIAPDYLFKAARVLIGLGSYQQAISYFERIKAHFPAYEKRGDAQFFIGFVFDEHLDQQGKAKENYEIFIEKYPTHNMVDDAQALIEKLGMSDEEWLQMVQERNKDLTDSTVVVP